MIRFLTLILFLAFPSFAQDVRLVASIGFDLDDARFGGWSGLYITDDGKGLVSVSDRGYLMTGDITRGVDRLSAVTVTSISRLRQIDGKPVSGRNSNSEGMAVGKNGVYYFSFEGFHRVRAHATLSSRATHIPPHPDFKFMQNNSSLEALAIDDTGALYTMPERSGVIDRPFPVYRFKNGEWTIFGHLPRSGEFLAVGADVGPDGRFYLLERAFTWLGGFSTRVRSFRIGTDGFEDELTLVETTPGVHDNLEGISVWRDAADRIRITMISDDNFQIFQRTELVEYVVADDN
ncbi:hypothetical protein BFP76_11250 [Amylibacter kogurei]|uniref:Phytase-like domain-containing protein n=1 Tax=Paramylibacter kogurei TaxID=1889778 RepID=A0A2G5KBQ7_9RHOB|nr:esterase-like activity of phytase family protein [Amylibacter kogurei]PIB26482.1 hypothetical protein BFP76_11250 [Amylibacter kogurei]